MMRAQTLLRLLGLLALLVLLGACTATAVQPAVPTQVSSQQASGAGSSQSQATVMKPTFIMFEADG